MSKSVTLHWAPADLAAVGAGRGVWRCLDPMTGVWRPLTASERAEAARLQAERDVVPVVQLDADSLARIESAVAAGGGYGWFALEDGRLVE